MKTSSLLLASVLAIAAWTPSLAGAQSASSPAGSGMKSGAPVGDMAAGEVRKIDKDSKKITLKHGEIKNLGMPGMTMVFQVKDPAMLDSVKSGDKVMFTADKVNGALTVTSIQAAK